MTTTFDSRLRAFKEDNRGAIMVLGIFFACIMIGWMWMLVGLGDAMIWRDRSQEAADAITYSSSAVQAKAMNLISFINMVMMILAGVYLVLAMIYNILDFAHVLLGSTDDGLGPLPSSCDARAGEINELGDALDATGYGAELGAILNYLSEVWCPAAGVIQGLHSAEGKLLEKMEDLMVDVMPAMSTFEDLVSYAAPWAGEATGVYVGTKYVDWGNQRMGVALSATLIPATFSPGKAGSFPAKKYQAEDDPNCESSDPNKVKECKEFNGGDKREGLPVEIPDDGMSILCKVAAQAALRPVTDFVEKIPLIGSILSSLLDGLADSLKDNYCMPDSRGFFNPVDDILAWAMQIVTLAYVDEWGIPTPGGLDNTEKCPKDNWGHSGGGSGDLGSGGPGTCNYVYQIHKNGDNFWHNPEKIGGPHTLVGYAGNGGDWFQSWSMVYGGNRSEQAEKKVAVAGMDSNGSGTWRAIVPENSQTLGSLYMAQSEFYFDCDKKWSDKECNGGTNDANLASYSMQWRARLRRIHGLSWTQNLFNYLWGGSLNGGFDQKALSWLEGGESSAFQSISQQFSSFLGNSMISGAYGALKTWAGDTIGGAINPSSFIPETIH